MRQGYFLIGFMLILICVVGLVFYALLTSAQEIAAEPIKEKTLPELKARPYTETDRKERDRILLERYEQMYIKCVSHR